MYDGISRWLSFSFYGVINKGQGKRVTNATQWYYSPGGTPRSTSIQLPKSGFKCLCDCKTRNLNEP